MTSQSQEVGDLEIIVSHGMNIMSYCVQFCVVYSVCLYYFVNVINIMQLIIMFCAAAAAVIH